MPDVNSNFFYQEPANGERRSSIHSSSSTINAVAESPASQEQEYAERESQRAHGLLKDLITGLRNEQGRKFF